MNLLRPIRLHQARSGRSVLVGLMAVWLNLVLQPCAMALSADQLPHCPRCPVGHAHGSAAHSQDSAAARAADSAAEAPMEHGMSAAAMAHHDGHAAMQLSSPGEDISAGMGHACPGRLAQCADLDQVNHQPHSDDVSFAVHPIAWIDAGPGDVCLEGPISAAVRAPGQHRSALPGASPPLNVLYCVYLN